MHSDTTKEENGLRVFANILQGITVESLKAKPVQETLLEKHV